MTGTIIIAATSGDWRNAVRVAVGLGLGADDCYAAGDAAWDAGDLRAAQALSRAAAWFSESPAERRRSRAFPVPESVGIDTIEATGGLMVGQITGYCRLPGRVA